MTESQYTTIVMWNPKCEKTTYEHILYMNMRTVLIAIGI